MQQRVTGGSVNFVIKLVISLQLRCYCFLQGKSVALLPVNRLPPKPRQHFHAAGREFTHGLATLVHGLADGIEEMAKDTNPSTTLGDGPHTDGESD